MKKVSIILPFIAFVMAISFSAFTAIKKTSSDYVWFKTNPSTGLIIDRSDGTQGDEPPEGMSCDGNNQLCSLAFSISQGQVELVGTHYELKDQTTENQSVFQRYEP